MSQGGYEVTTERTSLDLEQRLQHTVNPQPRHLLFYEQFPGQGLCDTGWGKGPGLTSPISDCSADDQVCVLVRPLKGNVICSSATSWARLASYSKVSLDLHLTVGGASGKPRFPFPTLPLSSES